MEFIKIIFLAIIQGITEFLPISSSGHLAICENILNSGDGHKILIATVLHAGTLLSILIFYRKILKGLIQKDKRNIIINIIVASIPIGVIGISLHLSGLTDSLFNNMYFPGIGLFFTGIILLLASDKKKNAENAIQLEKMSIKTSMIIGCFQGLAILPGISRSGTTIATALKLKVNKESAATFSFLIAIPAIAGASTVEMISTLTKHNLEITGINWSALGVGFAVSAIVGYFALKILLKAVKRGSLKGYAIYCFCLGTFAVVYKLMG